MRLISSAGRSASLVAILLLLTLAATAKTNRVTIGTLTYLGTKVVRPIDTLGGTG
jgi:hypothetical protein